MGKGSGTVTAFTFRKSVHSRRVRSDFGTRTTGEAQELSLSCIMPSCSKLSNSFLKISPFSGCRRYGVQRIGCVPEIYSIWKTPRLIFPGMSENTSANSAKRSFSSTCSSSDRDNKVLSIAASVVDSSGTISRSKETDKPSITLIAFLK